MKLKTLLTCVGLAFFLFYLTGCSSDDLGKNEFAEVTETDSPEFSVLGEKKNIAFSVENIRLAYENLKKNKTATQWRGGGINNKSGNEEYEITTTHIYYRFSPQDSVQYERLVNDSILSVSDVPFEYNLEIVGDKYQDPAFVGTDFTYYYAVVPVNYQIPTGIQYEVVSNLHFTPEDAISDNPTPQQLNELDFYYDLNLQALKDADNLEESEVSELTYLFTMPNGTQQQMTWAQAQSSGYSLDDLVIDFSEIEPLEKRRKWNPHGRVTVEEGALTRLGSGNNIIGVAGAQVKVRKWGFLVIKTARTDTNGNFTCSSTRTKRVKYAVYFNNGSNFTVKAGTVFWNAYYRSTQNHNRTGWFQHFPENFGRAHFYSLVQNAARDYYNRIYIAYNIWQPLKNLRISAKYDACASSQARPHWLPFISEIRITRKNGDCNYRMSDGVYATTVHELTHSAHRKNDAGMYSIFHSGSKTRDVLCESWAEGVETIVTNDRYNNFSTDYGNRYNDLAKQRELPLQMDEYTPLVIDLIDNFNQRTNVTPNNPNRPNDNVWGYTLNQIQSTLKNSREINEWQNKIVNNYNNATEAGVPILFDYVRQARQNIE